MALPLDEKKLNSTAEKSFKTLTLSPWSLSCEHCHSCGQTPILRPLERPQPPTFESHCYSSSCQALWQIFLLLCRFLTQINFAVFFSLVFNTYHSIWLFQIITVVADSTDHYISNWKCWENLMIFAFCFFMAQSCNLTGCFWTEGVGSNGVLLARIVKRFYCLLLFLFIKWLRVIKKGVSFS